MTRSFYMPPKTCFSLLFFLSSQILQVELFISQNGISKEYLNNKHLIFLLKIPFHPVFLFLSVFVCF